MKILYCDVCGCETDSNCTGWAIPIPIDIPNTVRLEEGTTLVFSVKAEVHAHQLFHKDLCFPCFSKYLIEGLGRKNEQEKM